MLVRKPLLNLELTNYCNLRCPLCYNRSLSRDRGYMSLDTLSDILSRFRGDIVFCGLGEPLLHPYVDHFIHYCHDVGGSKLSLLTNGVFLKKWSWGIVDYIDYVEVSMDGIHH